MILAAGLGTRLLPVTEKIPKALVEIGGKTLLERAILKLAREGFTELVINIHHHSKMIREYLSLKKFQDVTIYFSDESDKLLDTGGGILKARKFLDGDAPFLVYNVDIITNLELRALYQFHRSCSALVTLAVTSRKSERYFLFDKQDRLCGWQDVKNHLIRWSAYPVEQARQFAFSGIHVIDPAIFDLITETGRFSVVDSYLRIAISNEIKAYDHTGSDWFDLGKPGQIDFISEYIRHHPERFEE